MQLTSKQRDIGIVVGVLTAVVLIYSGFGTELKRVSNCTGFAEKYITAEFSETSVSQCTDMDGYSTTCMETDYWSEPASEVFSIYTQNGKINTKHPHEVVGGVAIPAWPEIDVDYSGDIDFDNYKRHISTKYTTTFDDGSYVTDPINIHGYCMQMRGENISVKTWWGIGYGVEG